MSFDGNNPDYTKERWVQDECETVYNINEDDLDLSTLVCKCLSLKNRFVGVITDRDRKLEILPIYRFKYHSILLWVLIPLIMLGCCGPCVMICLDSLDYQWVENDEYHDVKEFMVQGLMEQRGEKVYEYKE